MLDSLLKNALDGLFRTAFKVIGFVLGLIPLFILFALLFSYEDDKPEKQFNEFVEPNHDGTRRLLSHSKPTILQINIDGMIGTPTLTKARIEEMLVESREGDLKHAAVAGILLMINTPGGTVIDSDGIYRAIKAYKEQFGVPVFGYIDGLSASGGMYVAAAADRLFASDISVIGSIGVILSPFFNVSDTMEKLGIKSLTLSAGEGKDAMSMTRPWKPDEDRNLKMLVNYTYDQFVSLISKARNIPQKEIVDKLGAQIFPAAAAKEFGLVDEVGASRQSTLLSLLQAAGVDPNDYQVVTLQKENVLKSLFNVSSPLFTGKVEHEITLDGIPQPLRGKLLYLYHPGL